MEVGVDGGRCGSEVGVDRNTMDVMRWDR
jgi:hypothetical protein